MALVAFLPLLLLHRLLLEVGIILTNPDFINGHNAVTDFIVNRVDTTPYNSPVESLQCLSNGVSIRGTQRVLISCTNVHVKSL